MFLNYYQGRDILGLSITTREESFRLINYYQGGLSAYQLLPGRRLLGLSITPSEETFRLINYCQRGDF